jgi:hypothetical protein
VLNHTHWTGVVSQPVTSPYEDAVALLIKHGPQTERAKDLGMMLGNSQAFVYISLFGFTPKQII